jgi:hypothetical protein
MSFTTKIRGRIFISDELSVLSNIYCRIRDESGEGCSTFPTPAVRDDRGFSVVGHFSYNGRIWDCSGKKIIYDNRVSA